MRDRLPGSPTLLSTVLTALLALSFVAAFAVSSVVTWARSGILDPEYVKGLFREMDLYALLREEGLPAWLDRELREFGVDEPQQRAFAVHVLTEVVSEEELRERLDHAVGEVLPYIAGRSDEMTIRPRLDEWVLEVPETLARLDFSSWVVDGVLAPKLRPALEALAGEPLGVRVEPDEARDLAREIAPPEWVDGQVVGATYAVARWAVGAQRTFEIRIDYSERVDAATAVFKRLLRRSAVEDLLLDRVVLPMAERGLRQLPPFAEGVDRDALREVVREAAPEGWLSRQVDRVIGALGEWLAGRTEELDYTVQTGELAGAAGDIVAELLGRTLGPGAAGAAAAPLLAEVRRHFPERTTWTTADLRTGIGEEAYQELLRMRGFVREGFVYDQENLRRDLRTQLGLTDQEIDRLRHVLGASYAYTEVDLLEVGLGTEAEALLLAIRGAMRYEPAAHAAVLLLLLALFLASGPGMWRRGLVTLGTLALAGLVVWLVVAPWAAAVLSTQAEAFLPGSEQLAGTPVLDRLLAAAREAARPLAAWGRNVFLLMGFAWLLLTAAALRTRARLRS